jgi:hypothetical protein
MMTTDEDEYEHMTWPKDEKEEKEQKEKERDPSYYYPPQAREGKKRGTE